MGTWFEADPAPGLAAELSVLAAFLADNTLLDEELIALDDLQSSLTRSIFELMLGLHGADRPVTPVTLGDRDPKRAAMYWELTDHASFTPEEDAAIVRANGVRFRMREAAQVLAALADDPERSVDEILDRSRRAVEAAEPVRRTGSVNSFDEVIDAIDELGQPVKSYPLPWPRVQSLLRGLRPGGLYVLGARPGVGKSAIALQIATHLEAHGRVGFFSLEMGRRELTHRIIAQGAQVPLSAVDGSSRISQFQREKIARWQPEYHGRMVFDERSSVTVYDIRSQARLWHREEPLSAIVVDYLQLIGGQPGQSRYEVVSETSRLLKLMARELNVPVIALSQLRRDSEQHGRRPTKADLRESGSIEQDADVVILLHNVNQADPEYRPSMFELEELEFIFAKNRQGRMDVVSLDWDGQFVSAYDSYAEEAETA